jgi:DNA-binding NarL/FixJ family response regulator
MPADPVVAVVDRMKFRRALVVHFLQEWAAAQRVEILSFLPEEAHATLREGISCRMIIFNVGVGSCASPDTASEIKFFRALAPGSSLVVIADAENCRDVIAAMQCGAEGYLSNQCAPDFVLRALSFVLEGGTYFPPSAVASGPVLDRAQAQVVPEVLNAEPHLMVGAVPTPAAEQPYSLGSQALELSGRQRAIVEGLCRGEPNKMIGRSLNLPESTVKVHVREIMRKLSVSNRTQVALAISRMRSSSNDDHSSAPHGGGASASKSPSQAPPVAGSEPVKLPTPRADIDASLDLFARPTNPCAELRPMQAGPLGPA